MFVRPAEPDDVCGMQQLASRVWPSGWHPGGLGWGLSRHALGDSVVVAVDEGTSGPIVGFAGHGGDEISHVESDRDDVADALVTWRLAVDSKAPITVWDGADALARAVLRAGLEPVGRKPWSGMVVDVASVRDDPRRHADGYAIRPVGRRDRCTGRSAPRRVEAVFDSLHRRTRGRPRSREFVHVRGVRCGARRVAVRQGSRPRGGRRRDGFGACCIAWFDPATGVCEIEPLGVAPEHRRRGLAVALCLEVAHLVGERGGTHLHINTQPKAGYVASSSAYFAAGFELVERATTYAAPGLR